MARREIGTSWDRENRNNINENFKELYDVQDRAIEEATQAVIDSAKLIWLEPVNTFTDITTTYPNPEVGHTVFVRDTGKVYRFYNDIWGEIQQIDAGPVNEIDTRLSAEIDENKQEIEQARTKADGTTFPVLRDRLNDVDDKIGILSNLISQDNLVSKDNIPADHLKENIDFGVSKFGIYFDGINASVTTIRDLTLKTNTTYILSVKANANGKRIRFQSYPDGVFVSPNYMISGETNIEYEFQTNDTVVTQIKVVQVDNLSGEEIVLTDIVLREKNEELIQKVLMIRLYP